MAELKLGPRSGPAGGAENYAAELVGADRIRLEIFLREKGVLTR